MAERAHQRWYGIADPVQVPSTEWVGTKYIGIDLAVPGMDHAVYWTKDADGEIRVLCCDAAPHPESKPCRNASDAK